VQKALPVQEILFKDAGWCSLFSRDDYGIVPMGMLPTRGTLDHHYVIFLCMTSWYMERPELLELVVMSGQLTTRGWSERHDGLQWWLDGWCWFSRWLIVQWSTVADQICTLYFSGSGYNGGCGSWADSIVRRRFGTSKWWIDGDWEVGVDQIDQAMVADCKDEMRCSIS